MRDRPLTQVGVGPLPSAAIIALCEAYNATLEDFEKVLYLDSILYKGPTGAADEGEDQKSKLPPMPSQKGVKRTTKRVKR